MRCIFLFVFPLVVSACTSEHLEDAQNDLEVVSILPNQQVNIEYSDDGSNSPAVSIFNISSGSFEQVEDLEPESSDSSPMEVLSRLCPNCSKTLNHINLMSGNTLSFDYLMSILSQEENTELTDIYNYKISLEYVDPELAFSINQYEQNVLGYLLKPEQLQNLVSDHAFQDYHRFLKESDDLVNGG